MAHWNMSWTGFFTGSAIQAIIQVIQSRFTDIDSPGILG
jgi:hypothetical protein